MDEVESSDSSDCEITTDEDQGPAEEPEVSEDLKIMQAESSKEITGMFIG